MGPRTALSRLLWLVLLSLGCVLFGRFLYQNLIPLRSEFIDFYQEWSSARSFKLGRPIYQPTEELAFRDFGYRATPENKWLLGYNLHPPTSVLISLPWGWLDYQQAFRLWNLLNVGLGLICCSLISGSITPRWTTWTWITVLALWLWSNAFWHQIQQGQLNFLLLFCLTLAWRSHLRGRWVWTGFWLGWAAALKLYPAFFGLYFLVRRDWKSLASCIAWGLLILTLTTAVLGPSTMDDYIHKAIPEALEWRSANTNGSWSGWCYRLFDPGPRGCNVEPISPQPIVAKALIALGWLVVLGLLIPVIRAARTPAEESYAWSMISLGMLLLSPTTWEHYFLLLIAPLMCLWQRVESKPGLRPLFWLGVCILNSPVYRWVSQMRSDGNRSVPFTPWESLGIPSLYCYALWLLFALCWWVRPRPD